MVVGLLGNESPDSNRFILVTPKSENDVRLQVTLGNQNPMGLPVGAVRMLTDDIYIICNKNAKSENMPPNMKIGLFDVICGNIIVCGKDEEGFDSLPIDFQTWKRIVSKWND